MKGKDNSRVQTGIVARMWIACGSRRRRSDQGGRRPFPRRGGPRGPSRPPTPTWTAHDPPRHPGNRGDQTSPWALAGPRDRVVGYCSPGPIASGGGRTCTPATGERAQGTSTTRLVPPPAPGPAHWRLGPHLHGSRTTVNSDTSVGAHTLTALAPLSRAWKEEEKRKRARVSCVTTGTKPSWAYIYSERRKPPQCPHRPPQIPNPNPRQPSRGPATAAGDRRATRSAADWRGGSRWRRREEEEALADLAVERRAAEARIGEWGRKGWGGRSGDAGGRRDIAAAAADVGVLVVAAAAAPPRPHNRTRPPVPRRRRRLRW